MLSLILPSLCGIFTLSITLDLNWKNLREITAKFRPTKLLLIIRTCQVTSIFLAVSISLIDYLTSPSLETAKIIAAVFLATAIAIVTAVIAHKKLARLSPEDTVEEKDLCDKIRQEVVTALRNEVDQLKNAAYAMLERITSENKNWLTKIEKAAEDNKAALSTINSLTNKANKIFESYNTAIGAYSEKTERLAQLYTEELQKYEELVELHQSAKYLEEELRRIVNQLSPMEPAKQEELLKHGESIVETLASKSRGAEIRKNVAERFREMGYETQAGGRNRPDIILYCNSQPIAVVVSCGFTLTAHGNRQRWIHIATLEPELKAAERLGVPLIIMVTNLANKRVYALFVPYSDIAELRRSGGITTPSLLVEEGAEAEKQCKESVESLREKLIAEAKKKQFAHASNYVKIS